MLPLGSLLPCGKGLPQVPSPSFPPVSGLRFFLLQCGFARTEYLYKFLVVILDVLKPVIPAGTRIGHVHLKVADLQRALDFYCGVLGFELQQMYGDQAAFISAGGYHHHIGLNTWESKGGSPPPPGSTGLYHTAILYPTRVDLADAFKRMLSAGVELDGAADHGVSVALYFRDPDQNGIELYWDKPEADWPRGPDGKLAMMNARIDLKELLSIATQ
jgi:catechol 2,3-dioxygenase